MASCRHPEIKKNRLSRHIDILRVKPECFIGTVHLDLRSQSSAFTCSPVSRNSTAEFRVQIMREGQELELAVESRTFGALS
ncbi:hypothetical protein ElyMa_003381500 [Elysia marginata]|uniref:Uncharacterized protein n=1 Tax=Elysia marginata TaxID=1093978 RepID=A0AAV4JQB3_9GAST|nr:hypothetical protein ElyMa_003381500 [Elysia marginata]